MRCLVKTFFQDDAGKWHQPGNVDEFGPEEARRREEQKFIKIIDTAMVQQPETRVVEARQRRQRKCNAS